MSGQIYTDIAIFDSIFQKRTEFSDFKSMEFCLRKFQCLSNSRFVLKETESQTNGTFKRYTYCCARNSDEEVKAKGGCPAFFVVTYDKHFSRKAILTSKMLCHNHYGVPQKYEDLVKLEGSLFNLVSPLMNNPLMSPSPSGGQFVVTSKPDVPESHRLTRALVTQSASVIPQPSQDSMEEFLLPDVNIEAQSKFYASNSVSCTPNNSPVLKRLKPNPSSSFDPTSTKHSGITSTVNVITKPIPSSRSMEHLPHMAKSLVTQPVDCHRVRTVESHPNESNLFPSQTKQVSSSPPIIIKMEPRESEREPKLPQQVVPCATTNAQTTLESQQQSKEAESVITQSNASTAQLKISQLKVFQPTTVEQKLPQPIVVQNKPTQVLRQPASLNERRTKSKSSTARNSLMTFRLTPPLNPVTKPGSETQVQVSKQPLHAATKPCAKMEGSLQPQPHIQPIKAASLMRKGYQPPSASAQLRPSWASPKDTVGSGEVAWPAQNNLPSPGPSRKHDSLPRPSTSRKSDHVPRPSTSTSSLGGFNIKPDPGTPPPMVMNPYVEQMPPQPAPRLLPKPMPPQQSQQQQPMRLRVRPPPPMPPPPPEPEQEPQQVCLRWNSFHSNMQTMFPSLLTREKFVDVTLACEGRSIKCHKVVLSSCSSYLERLLSENPCKHPIIMMPRDLRFWECRALVDFMYRGEVNVEHEQLPSLLAAAEALQIKGLAGPASSLPDQEDEAEEPPPSPRHKRKRTASPPPPHMAPLVHPTPPPRPRPPPRESLPVSPPRVQLSPPLLPNSPAVSITRLVPRSQASSSNSLPQRQTAASPASHLDMQAHSPGIEITPVVSFEEIKMEPIDISDSNDESMDHLDQGHDFDMDKDYEGEDAALASGGDEDDAGGGSGSGSHMESHLDSHMDSHSGNNGVMDSAENQDQLGADMSTSAGFSGNGLDFTNDLDDEQGADLEEEGYADLAMPNEAGEPPDEDERVATMPGDA